MMGCFCFCDFLFSVILRGCWLDGADFDDFRVMLVFFNATWKRLLFLRPGL